MLRPVTENAITLALLDAIHDQEAALRTESPVVMHQAVTNLRTNLKIAYEVLTGLGFVIAREEPDREVSGAEA